jgi:hypothetical protein
MGERAAEMTGGGDEGGTGDHAESVGPFERQRLATHQRVKHQRDRRRDDRGETEVEVELKIPAGPVAIGAMKPPRRR